MKTAEFAAVSRQASLRRVERTVKSSVVEASPRGAAPSSCSPAPAATLRYRQPSPAAVALAARVRRASRGRRRGEDLGRTAESSLPDRFPTFTLADRDGKPTQARRLAGGR